MSDLFPVMREDVSLFAAAIHSAHRGNRSRNTNRNSSPPSSTDEDEIESIETIFDEFGAFEPAPINDVNSDHVHNQRANEQVERLSARLKGDAIATQKNNSDLRGAVQARSALKQQVDDQQVQQKSSPKACATNARSTYVECKADIGHARAATDPLSSVALSRMRYYRKLIPAPKAHNTSPKSEPRPQHHLCIEQPADSNRRFFPPSQSAAAILYHNHRSLPIAIPLKKLSPTHDDGHRFRADLHPRLAADSSFILPAASYLSSATPKSFVPPGESAKHPNTNTPKKHSLSVKFVDSLVREDDSDSPFGFQFEMDL